MPIDNLVVNSNSPQGSMLKALASNLQNAANLAAQILALMNQQTDGSSFATIETQFGLATGQGQTMYNLIAGLSGAGGSLVSSNVTQFLGRTN